MVKALANISSFSDCLSFLGDKTERRIAENTYITKKSNGIAVTFHKTDIIIYYPNGMFSASSKNYPTKTTTERLNQFGPAKGHFFHKKGVLYFGFNNELGEYNTVKCSHDILHPIPDKT